MLGILMAVIGFIGVAATTTSPAAERTLARPATGQCADPAVDIEVALVSKTGTSSGRVRITGIARNLGSLAWKSTTKNHRLHLVLAAKDSEARADGEPVEPALAISSLAPGQAFRIDHQMDWNTNKPGAYPKYIVYFSDSGKPGAAAAQHRSDCRSDNNRKEVSAADINKLFSPASTSGKPLEVQGYRLLGGVDANTVESLLAYKKNSSAAGKITVSVAAPYSGSADEVAVSGNTGFAAVRIQIRCDRVGARGPALPPVVITHRLWNSLGQPGGASRWVAGFSADQSIPYDSLCAAKR